MVLHSLGGVLKRTILFVPFTLVLVILSCIPPRPDPATAVPGTDIPLTVEEGVLTVAIDGNWPPFQFADESGQGTGFDVDLAIEVAKRLGLEARIVPDTWSAAQAMVRQGSADCIFSLTPTDDRARVYDFSAPYRQDKVTVFVKKDSPIQGIEDLYGKPVAAEGGSTNLMRQVLTSHYEQLRIKTTESPAESLQALQDDEVEAVFIGAAEVGYYIARYLGLELRPVYEAAGVSETVGIKKGNVTLLEQVNQALAEIKTDGTLDLINNQWFGHD